MPRSKVFFVLPNLLTGGAQRAVLNVVEHISCEEFEPVLVILTNPKKKLKNSLTGEGLISNFNELQVRSVFLDCSNVKYSLLPLLRLVAKERPRAIIVTISYVVLFFGFFRFLFPSSLAMIARETNVLSRKYSRSKIRQLKRLMHHLAYKPYDCIIAQSEDMSKDLVDFFGVSRRKIEVINNPVNIRLYKARTQDAPEAALAPSSGPRLLTVGHLTEQKCHDILIAGLAISQQSEATLHIVGRGPELERLKSIAEDLKVSGRVFFYGFQENPFPFYATADYYVSASAYEGFPNAMIEAASFGLPIIARDSPGGIGEIVTPDVGVRFSGGAAGFAEAISDILDRLYDRENIKDFISARYEIDSIADQYRKVLKRLIKF